MNINENIEKKEYVAPQMTVLKMDGVATPLCCSDNCGYGSQSPYDEGESLD